IVFVLHRRDLEHLRGRLDVGYGDLAEPDVTDEAFVLQLLEGTELLALRRARIDAMELPERNLLEAEIAQTAEHLLAQIVGPCERVPAVGAWPDQAAFRRDDRLAVGVERFANELFGDVRAVRVGGIDEVDAEFRHALEG